MAETSSQEVIGGGILLRVAQFEDGAMKRCIEQYGGLVWSLTSRYIPTRSDAEDVVQEVFTELWKCAGRFDPTKASESTFIGLIARRRSIDWLRKHSRQPKLEVISDDIEQPDQTSACSPFGGDRIKLALQKLPEATQRLFSLHFDQGMTHPEIAEQTGLPIGTVKTKLRRGLIAMRSAMQQSEPSYTVS